MSVVSSSVICSDGLLVVVWLTYGEHDVSAASSDVSSRNPRSNCSKGIYRFRHPIPQPACSECRSVPCRRCPPTYSVLAVSSRIMVRASCRQLSAHQFFSGRSQSAFCSPEADSADHLRSTCRRPMSVPPSCSTAVRTALRNTSSRSSPRLYRYETVRICQGRSEKL